MPFLNPLGLPTEILGIIEHSITLEYASLRKDGMPITVPISQFISEDGCSIDVATGLAYTAKAQRARNNAKVCYLFSEPKGSGIANPPTVLIYGHAAVRDADLQSNTDRYIRAAMTRFPEVFARFPRFMMTRMNWYFSRIWIEVTPLRILWWRNGDLTQKPQHWHAPEDIEKPTSDPPPRGKGLPRWDSPPTDWHNTAKEAVEKLPSPILTVVDNDGYPVPFRTRGITLGHNGFNLDLYPTMPAELKGKACLTFHTHGEIITWQRNLTFIGEIMGTQSQVNFKVERQITSVNVSRNQVALMLSMLQLWRRFAPRIHHEAARRGQSVPMIRLPGDSSVS